MLNNRRTRADLAPIETTRVSIEQIRERCLKCGKLVEFRARSSRDGVRYVTCPACGADHAQHGRQHRLVQRAGAVLP